MNSEACLPVSMGILRPLSCGFVRLLQGNPYGGWTSMVGGSRMSVLVAYNDTPPVEPP
jgi:hypothetical protein